jgi:chromosome partitioning protein
VVQEKGFDLVIIDTPARAEPINAAAAQVADFCLIPCQPSLADMRAQSPTVQTLKRLEKRGAFVLTRCPPRGPRTKEAERGLLVFGVSVSPISIKIWQRTTPVKVWVNAILTGSLRACSPQDKCKLP